MRYAKSIPETDPLTRSKYLAQGWQKLKEPPSLLLAVVASIPFMLIAFMINFLILWKMNPGLFAFTQSHTIQFTIKLTHIFFFILGLYAYMFLHEMVHLVFIPGFLSSEKTLWGIHAGFGFVYTEEPLLKWRFVLISVMPYILLSLTATAVVSALGIMNGYLAVIFLLNAGGACVDFLNVALIAVQVPNKGKIVSNGNETYFFKGLLTQAP